MENTVCFYGNYHQPKKCVIEFQAFRNNRSKFIIKELVFLDISTSVLNYFLFKAPFPFRVLNSKSSRTNVWLTKHLHYIRWDEGFTEYKELDNIMNHYCQQYDEIYTSGDEKSKWIGTYTRSKVVNVLLDKTFNAQFNGLCIGVKCDQHKMNGCALSRAYSVSSLISCGGGSGGGSAYISQ